MLSATLGWLEMKVCFLVTLLSLQTGTLSLWSEGISWCLCVSYLQRFCLSPFLICLQVLTESHLCSPVLLPLVPLNLPGHLSELTSRGQCLLFFALSLSEFWLHLLEKVCKWKVEDNRCIWSTTSIPLLCSCFLWNCTSSPVWCCSLWSWWRHFLAYNHHDKLRIGNTCHHLEFECKLIPGERLAQSVEAEAGRGAGLLT